MKKYDIYLSQGEKRFTETVQQDREFVGSVEAESIQHAFALTQNFEGDWNKENPCRSTSVGDVIGCDDGFFMIMGTDFKRFNIDDIDYEKYEKTPSDRNGQFELLPKL